MEAGLSQYPILDNRRGNLLRKRKKKSKINTKSKLCFGGSLDLGAFQNCLNFDSDNKIVVWNLIIVEAKLTIKSATSRNK